MHLDYLISDLALITIAAGVVTLIFKKLKLPIVLGYIVAGFLISPNFTYLPTVVESADIHVWANIGVVFLMFGLGLEDVYKRQEQGLCPHVKNPAFHANVIKLRNIEKSQIEKYGFFLLKSVDNSHDLCGRFYQILRSGR